MALETDRVERFESPEISKQATLLSALGFLLLLGLAIGSLQAIYYREVPVQKYPAPEEFPQPRVQTGQSQQLHRLEAAQTKLLSEYRWIDRDKGIVQIPIGRAMQILAGEGTQAYAPLAPPQALTSPAAGAERLITPQAGVSPPGKNQTPPHGAPSQTGPASGTAGSAPASQNSPSPQEQKP